MKKKRGEQQEKKVQEEIEKKARADARVALKILKIEEQKKKKEEAARKKAEKEAQKARQLASRALHQNPPNDVPKSRR